MAKHPTRSRPCTYCPEPAADTCIRSHRTEAGETVHVYAHSRCARTRQITPLYVFTEGPAAMGEPR